MWIQIPLDMSFMAVMIIMSFFIIILYPMQGQPLAFDQT